jgi:hypothetical protein
MWQMSHDSARCVSDVTELTDEPFSTGQATVLLLDAVSHEGMNGKPMLVVLNKVDIAQQQMSG